MQGRPPPLCLPHVETETDGPLEALHRLRAERPVSMGEGDAVEHSGARENEISTHDELEEMNLTDETMGHNRTRWRGVGGGGALCSSAGGQSIAAHLHDDGCMDTPLRCETFCRDIIDPIEFTVHGSGCKCTYFDALSSLRVKSNKGTGDV